MNQFLMIFPQCQIIQNGAVTSCPQGKQQLAECDRIAGLFQRRDDNFVALHVARIWWFGCGAHIAPPPKMISSEIALH